MCDLDLSGVILLPHGACGVAGRARIFMEEAWIVFHSMLEGLKLLSINIWRFYSCVL